MVDCLDKREFFGIGVACDAVEVQEAIRVRSEDLWRTLYAKCLQISVATAIDNAVKQVPDATLAVICDRQREFQGAGKRAFKEMINHPEFRFGERIDPCLKFRAKDEVIPLQAADFAAYEIYKGIHNHLYDPHPARMSLYRVYERFYSGIYRKQVFLDMLEADAKDRE